MVEISKEVNIDYLEKQEDGTFIKKNPSTTVEQVTESSKRRFVSDTEKREWNSKQPGFTPSSSTTSSSTTNIANSRAVKAAADLIRNAKVKLEIIMFETVGTETWTVPAGVTEVYVSGAGGGGSSETKGSSGEDSSFGDYVTLGGGHAPFYTSDGGSFGTGSEGSVSGNRGGDNSAGGGSIFGSGGGGKSNGAGYGAGAGGHAQDGSFSGRSGGGGGASILDKKVAVTPGESVTITVGRGGGDRSKRTAGSPGFIRVKYVKLEL